MSNCFVIPVYNHPNYLAPLIEHLHQFDLPIIVVNDGSDVECTQVLTDLAEQYERVELLSHAVNLGKGQAVMTGLLHAHHLGMHHALQIDADGQHCWADIPTFWQQSAANPKAMIIGKPIFDESVPKKRLYGRYITHVWVWINSLSFEIQDSMCGFRVYPLASTISIIQTADLQPRMGFDSEILVRLKWNKVPFINVPTHVVYPEQGISHFQMWRDNLGLSQTHAKLFAGMLVRLPKLLWHKTQGDRHD
ncbi:glycosyltransferase family 2 protein [Acinetobacter rudis]|uniref:Glycosyltransferase 2-like domain-containing protein n=1 Tax=Acinetobacter rudis CIP 110305 TaxID=421052 RepID=S3MTV3_9GAMM|nr:glycosyltransferase family 2 protein [Acinetobacter rudis]EPF70018.1 hypothetical protein F945_03582 [Acinetobacter rudis CIP 110305]